MAQMTCFTSFGPVLFVVASHRYICSFKISLIPVKWLVDIKNMNNKIKKLANGPNDAFRVVWARCPLRNLLPIPQYIYKTSRIHKRS